MTNYHNIYKDFADEIANYKFQKSFFSKYSSSKFDFLSDSLVPCLKQVVDKKRPLLFFLHDGSNPFSEKGCQFLLEDDLQKFICENFLIMGWEIGKANESFSNALAKKVAIIENVKTYITKNEPCVFIIIPDELSVKIEKCIEVTEKNMSDCSILLSAVKEVKKYMSIYYTGEYFKNMTSSKYQQWMYEEFGDRDYDSFEADEAELLKKKILFALYGSPKVLKDESIGYEEKQISEAEKIYEKIQLKNNEHSKWKDRIVISFIYNCIEPLDKVKQEKHKKVSNYKPEEDFCPVPVFVLRKCKIKKRKEDEVKEDEVKDPCRVFIDSDCRVYNSWEDYLRKNKLPPHKMIFPHGGKYRALNNNVWIEEKFTPSCSVKENVLKKLDVSASVAGMLSSVVLVASMFTPAAAITVPAAIAAGVSSGAYAVGRSSSVIVDRSIHEQNIGIANSESRAAYFNIAAGAMSAAGAGATKLLSQFASRGVVIGESVQHAVNVVNGANIIVSGSATVNSCYDVFQQYHEEGEKPSTLTIIQLSSSLFFFGNSVLNFRTAGSIIRETQTTAINEVSEALRSNRHRKTFNKLVKESMRLHGETTGRAEVISTMRNVGSRDDVLAVLTRSNKYFNKNGIRFSADSGGIKLNGVSTDLRDFGNLSKTQQGVYLEGLPPIPENSQAKISNITTRIQKMQFNNKVFKLFDATDTLNVKDVLNVASIITSLIALDPESVDKTMRICENFINQIDINIIKDLESFLSDTRYQIIRYFTNFIEEHAKIFKKLFDQRILNEDLNTICKEFDFKNSEVHMNNFIKYVINKLSESPSELMKSLLKEFQIWCDSLRKEKKARDKRKAKRHTGPSKIRKDCSKCKGYYYE